jgi:WD40 repeat protein
MPAVRLVALSALLAAPVAAADPPPRPPSVRSLAYSPDGKLLVAGVGGRNEPGVVLAWDVPAGTPRWERRGPAGFGSVTFAPDGKAVAVTHGQTTALRLDPATGKDLGEVGPHPATVRAVAHVPGTDLLATGSDGTVRLWDVKTGKVAKELKGGHPAEVTGLVVSPDGRWLISTGPDGARAWDVAAGAELKDAFRQDGNWYGVTFVAPDRVLHGTNNAVNYVRELPSGKEVLRFRGFGGGIAYAPAAGLLASRWTDDLDPEVTDLTFRAPTADEAARVAQLLKEFDADGYAARVAASEAMRKVGSVAEPALRKAAADGPSAEVRMRAREARRAILEEPLRSLKGHTAPVGPLAFSPDGAVLATGADDGTVRLWDPKTGKELARLEVPAAPRP